MNSTPLMAGLFRDRDGAARAIDALGVRPRSREDADYFEREWGRHRGHAIHR